MGVKVRKKGNDWWIFINHQGKRKSRKVGSKSAANALARTIEVELAAGRFGLTDDEERPKAFKDYCKEWLEVVMPTECEESTASDYRAIVKNHLEKAPFYAKPVDNITEGEIETFIIRKRGKFAESTCTHIKNAISNSFKRAIRARIIRHNPCSGLKIPKDKRRQETKKLTPYSQEEIETLLRAFEGNHYYPLVLFLARTGCRAGEAAGLKWEDLDLDARKAHIRRGFVRGKLSTPKSGKDRFIDLSPALTKELRKLKLARQKTGEWVFQNTAGGHVDMNNFRNRIFWPTVAKAGLRRTRLHDLRHSYASILIAVTKDLYYIQRQLGHHSIKVTVDRYGHLLDDKSESRIVDVLDGENFDQKRTLYAP